MSAWMGGTVAPRAVLVHRRTELDDLLDRHGTRGAAEFFLRTRGRTLAEVDLTHQQTTDALRAARAAVPSGWRRGDVERADLSRFWFEPGDVVVAVGPDGLVANVAKYLTGQPVVGVDPAPGRNAGILVRHRADQLAALLPALGSGQHAGVVEERVMVRARLDDGQDLQALNDVYVGAAGHQSSRYRLRADGPAGWPEPGERQSSSGVVVSTGTGATGWAASLVRERSADVDLPAPADPALAWFVREAWPSPATGTTHTLGRLDGESRLLLTVESDALVVFGDGLEADRLSVSWGQTITVGVSDRVLRLVAP